MGTSKTNLRLSRKQNICLSMLCIRAEEKDNFVVYQRGKKPPGTKTNCLWNDEMTIIPSSSSQVELLKRNQKQISNNQAII